MTNACARTVPGPALLEHKKQDYSIQTVQIIVTSVWIPSVRRELSREREDRGMSVELTTWSYPTSVQPMNESSDTDEKDSCLAQSCAVRSPRTPFSVQTFCCGTWEFKRIQLWYSNTQIRVDMKSNVTPFTFWMHCCSYQHLFLSNYYLNSSYVSTSSHQSGTKQPIKSIPMDFWMDFSFMDYSSSNASVHF